MKKSNLTLKRRLRKARNRRAHLCHYLKPPQHSSRPPLLLSWMMWRQRVMVFLIHSGSNAPRWNSWYQPTLGSSKDMDRAASWLQQFWFKVANLLIFILEKVDKWKLPAETIHNIQTTLKLMRNANYHHSTFWRNALMLQLNPKLKQLFKEEHFKNAGPLLFGESFGPLTRSCSSPKESNIKWHLLLGVEQSSSAFGELSSALELMEYLSW